MGAILALAGRAPVLVCVLAAMLAWGGWNRWQAQRHEAAAAVATANARAQAEAVRLERQAREIEQQRATKAQEQADAYAKQRRMDAAAAAGARAELDRLRDALASVPGPSAAASDAAAASGVDGAAGARIVVRECAATAVALAEAADACEARLSGLQGWVRAMIPAEAASAAQ